MCWTLRIAPQVDRRSGNVCIWPIRRSPKARTAPDWRGLRCSHERRSSTITTSSPGLTRLGNGTCSVVLVDIGIRIRTRCARRTKRASIGHVRARRSSCGVGQVWPAGQGRNGHAHRNNCNIQPCNYSAVVRQPRRPFSLRVGCGTGVRGSASRRQIVPRDSSSVSQESSRPSMRAHPWGAKFRHSLVSITTP